MSIIHDRLVNVAWLVLFLLTAIPVNAIEFQSRIKAFAKTTWLPSHDINRSATPLNDLNLDLRLMFEQQTGSFNFVAHHATAWVVGDSIGLAGAQSSELDRVSDNDEFRLFDLTWNIDNGNGHRSFQRLDRLAVSYAGSGWRLTLGRQAVSWGSGIVFQPFDLFNPFSPISVDQEYKPGDDLALYEQLFASGSDLQIISVARRDEHGDVSGAVGSLAAKWRGFSGDNEWELMTGRHYGEMLTGFSFRFPLGGALVRTDLVAVEVEGNWRLSGIVNMDVSFALANRTAYVFAEYFHNAHGVNKLPDNLALLPTPLLERLDRGELFNVMRDYLAVGLSYQLHPLLTQSLVLISNLSDGSSLVQIQAGIEPGDHQNLEIGIVATLGSAADEFGGLPLAGKRVTIGGGEQAYIRWAYHF